MGLVTVIIVILVILVLIVLIVQMSVAQDLAVKGPGTISADAQASASKTC